MNLRTIKLPDGQWECFDEDDDPSCEHAWETPSQPRALGDTRQQAVDNFFQDVLGLPYSVKVGGPK